MSESSSRTCSTVSKSVEMMLKKFTLAELLFLLQQDTSMPRIDEMRIRKIADGARFMYGDNQPNDNVAAAIESLADTFAQTRPMQKKGLPAIALSRSLEYFIVPFTNAFTSCGASVSISMSQERAVKIYRGNGSVVGVKNSHKRFQIIHLSNFAKVPFHICVVITRMQLRPLLTLLNAFMETLWS